MVWKSGLTFKRCKKCLVSQECREIILLSLAKKYVLRCLRWFCELLCSQCILVFTKAPTLTSFGTEILYLATEHVHHGQRHCKLPPVLHHFHHNITFFSGAALQLLLHFLDIKSSFSIKQVLQITHLWGEKKNHFLQCYPEF